MSSGKAEILLVEDDLHDAELTIRALRKNNIENLLVHVKDGEEAIDFIFCNGNYCNRNINDLPKLILLDLKMPKIDGIEVLKKIKADERTKRIPVVLLTSSKEEKDIIESYTYGVNSYIVKPMDFDSYVKSVSSVGLYWLLLNQLPY